MVSDSECGVVIASRIECRTINSERGTQWDSDSEHATVRDK